MECSTLLFHFLVPKMRDFIPECGENWNLALSLSLGVVVYGEIHECVQVPVSIVIDINALFAHENDIRYFIVANEKAFSKFFVCSPAGKVRGRNLQVDLCYVDLSE